MPSLAEFLNSLYAKSGEHSHTRIPSKEFNISGGKYNVVTQEDNEAFNDLYYKHVIQNKKQEYLTEKQYQDGVLCVDLDFHHPVDIESRQFNQDLITTITNAYVKNLMEIFDFKSEDTIKIYVMLKDDVNKLPDKTKDGIHIIFDLTIPRVHNKLLREKIISDIDIINALDEVPLINKITDVFDKSISDGSTNWQVYGSRKPAHSFYKLNYIYEYKMIEEFGELTCDADCRNVEHSDVTPELFKKLSIRNLDRPKYKLNENYVIDNNSPNNQIQDEQTHEIVSKEEDNFSRINSLLECIGSRRCSEGNHIDWVNVGQVLRNELNEDGNQLFINWTNRYGSDNKKNTALKVYNSIKFTPKKSKARLGIASLYMWAKMDNPEGFATIVTRNRDLPALTKEQSELFLEIDKVISLSNDNASAKLFIYLTNKSHVCVCMKPLTFYSYVNNVWIENEGVTIRNEMTIQLTKAYEIYNKYLTEVIGILDKNDPEYEVVNKKLNKLCDLNVCAGKTIYKNSMLKEFSDLTFDTDFVNKINKKMYHLPLSGGKIINLSTLEITDRKKEDYFTYECPVSFVNYNYDDEKFKYVDKYFADLFCGNLQTKQCTLNIIKSSLIGKPLRYIYFMSGFNGRNGKSTLIKKLQYLFGMASDTISKLVVIKQKGNNTNTINTELKKLTKGRIGFTSEFDAHDELNASRIKEITGGDKMDYRGLFKDNETITPTINLMCITNALPRFESDPAILSRIINIPFNNVFEIDNSFEDTLNKYDDYIFSYIMKQGVICDKFELSEEMLVAKSEYAQENENPVKSFIEERLIDCVNNREDKPIKIEDFREQFNYWCKKQTLPLDKSSKSTFTKMLLRYKLDAKESHGVRKIFGKKWRDEDDGDELGEPEQKADH
jgi:P4 family phage/plasmid primase-like protien